MVVGSFMGVRSFTYQYFVCLIEYITDLHLKKICFHSPSLHSAPDPTSLLKLRLSEVSIRIYNFSEFFIYRLGITRKLHAPVRFSRNSFGRPTKPCIGCMGMRCPSILRVVSVSATHFFPSAV